MVIGAGETSEKTARSLLSRGAKGIVVTNRSHEKAEALAQELGGRAVPFDQWDEHINEIDIIISSTSAPHYVLDREDMTHLMKTRRYRPILLIDIAVPRDIDPEINYVEEAFLYNIDDLQTIAKDYLKKARRRGRTLHQNYSGKSRCFIGGDFLSSTGTGITSQPGTFQPRKAGLNL